MAEGRVTRSCRSCGLSTAPHATQNGVDAEWRVRLALDKHLHGDALTAQDETVLAYGYYSGQCGQNLL
jgi:hypothetical protein